MLRNVSHNGGGQAVFASRAAYHHSNIEPIFAPILLQDGVLTGQVAQ